MGENKSSVEGLKTSLFLTLRLAVQTKLVRRNKYELVSNLIKYLTGWVLDQIAHLCAAVYSMVCSLLSSYMLPE